MSKNKIMFISLAVLLLAFFGWYFVYSDKNQEVDNERNEITSLKMGLIPADDAQEMLRQYKNVTDYLSERLGMPVEVEVTSDYTSAIEAMRAKHIDIAWFGPFSYILAHDIAGAEAIVNGVREETGKSTYKSIFIVKKGSGIETLEDLKEKKFAFVDPASTSGYLIPMKILTENNINPENDFKSTFFAGTHNAVELAVANGTVDAGADSDNSYNRMIKSGEINSEVNIIIHESKPIPGSPIAVRGDLPESLKQDIKKALIEMDEQTINKISGWGGINRYEEVVDSAYDVIRETAKILNLDSKN